MKASTMLCETVQKYSVLCICYTVYAIKHAQNPKTIGHKKCDRTYIIHKKNGDGKLFAALLKHTFKHKLFCFLLMSAINIMNLTYEIKRICKKKPVRFS